MKQFIALMCIAVLLLTPLVTFAKGGGGGRSGGGSRSSSSSRSSSTSRTSTTKSSPTARTSTPKPKVETKTKESKSTVNGKTYSAKGKVVGDGYKPKFKDYDAPAGSVVYYRDNGIMDWLPFYLIMSADNQHRTAIVETPDGQQKEVKEEGLDTMYVINWIVTILFSLLIIAGIMWAVYYFTVSRHNNW